MMSHYSFDVTLINIVLISKIPVIKNIDIYSVYALLLNYPQTSYLLSEISYIRQHIQMVYILMLLFRNSPHRGNQGDISIIPNLYNNIDMLLNLTCLSHELFLPAWHLLSFTFVPKYGVVSDLSTTSFKPCCSFIYRPVARGGQGGQLTPTLDLRGLLKNRNNASIYCTSVHIWVIIHYK